jgi:hypothetical protein
MAYSSNEGASGDGIYVRPFYADGKAGAAGARWLVSGNGFGRHARWRSDGKQLFYTASIPSLGVMAVDLETSKGFQAGTPRRLFDAPPPLYPVGWSLTPDAKRFLFITTPNGGRPLPFTVVLNWAVALKK